MKEVACVADVGDGDVSFLTEMKSACEGPAAVDVARGGMRGWVYVISNQSMPGIVKIGYSMKDPWARAEELAHTGTPLPYLVDYEVLVHEPQVIEQGAHEALKHVRLNEKREWFRCSTSAAVTAIRSVVGFRALLENYIRQTGHDAVKGWTLSRSTGVLTHVESGTQIQSGQYYADNRGHSPGFVIRHGRFHWVSRDMIVEIY